MNAEKIRPDLSKIDSSGYDSVPDDAAIERRMEGKVVPQSYLDMVDAEPDPEIREQLMRISAGYKRSPVSV